MLLTSSNDAIGFAASLIYSLTFSKPFSMPRFNSVGEAPATICAWALLIIAWASTVDVVVPSPAFAFVLAAACLITWAPTFSNGSSKSTHEATDTPSFVISGFLSFDCRITFLPFGPNVAATAFPSLFTPLIIFEFNSWPSPNTFFITYLSAINA